MIGMTSATCILRVAHPFVASVVGDLVCAAASAVTNVRPCPDKNPRVVDSILVKVHPITCQVLKEARAPADA